VKQFLSVFFIPQPKNNYRALLLHPGILGIFIAIYLFNQSLIKSFTIARPGVLGYSSEITAQKVFVETNSQRQKLGISGLSYNSTLSASATKKAEDMFKNNYWAHSSPNGKTPWDFFKEVNYQYSVAGENLAKDFYDTESMIGAWMKSPTHRKNILDARYQEIGIGVVNGVLNGVKTTLVVQHFATPINVSAVSHEKPPSEKVVNTQNSQVLSEVSVPQISPVDISKTIGAIMFVLIIGVLLIDGYVTLKNRTNRLTGSSAGHVGFLAIILLLLLFTRQGSVF
jgi:uncharacterized protein YkwD